MRGRWFSILPILTLNGIIAYDIVKGSVTSEQFVQFLQELVVCSYLGSLVSNAYFWPDTSDKSISWATKHAHFR